MFDSLSSENVGGCIGFEVKLDLIYNNTGKIEIELTMEERMRKFHPRVLFLQIAAVAPYPPPYLP